MRYWYLEKLKASGFCGSRYSLSANDGDIIVVARALLRRLIAARRWRLRPNWKVRCAGRLYCMFRLRMSGSPCPVRRRKYALKLPRILLST
jgi:hypothetical protein